MRLALFSVVMGGLSHIDCVVVVNLFRVVHALKHRQGLWNSKRGSPLYALKTWLHERGWQVASDWIWQVQGSYWTIDLTHQGLEGLRTNQHNLRDGWRWYMFCGFLNQNRHENIDINISIDMFLQFDFAWMRTFFDGAPTQRSVLLGAVRSPAVFQNHGSQEYPTQCVWGCGQLGSWNHCTWFCPNRPSVLSPPLNPVTERFGWFKKGVKIWTTPCGVQKLHKKSGSVASTL